MGTIDVTTPVEPRISWQHNEEKDNMVCSIVVPRGWLMELSLFKRRFTLWWWLTKLSWTLPK